MVDQPAKAPHNRFTSKRFIFSVIGLATATAMLWCGKLASHDWVWAFFGILAGHNIVDLARAWRGGSQ
jgi:hypothetical protein